MDPQGFARDLAAGNLSSSTTSEEKGLIVGDFSSDAAEEGQGQGGDKIPKPQNVVRMPPINWAKYQIVGEPLDKMHEEQLHRPSCGRPRPPEYVLASPYRPLVDELDTVPAKGKGRGGKT